jgi:hypothetical protein
VSNQPRLNHIYTVTADCNSFWHCADRSLLRNAYPKPDKQAQGKVPGANPVPFTAGIYALRAERPLLAIEPSTMSQEEADRRMRQTYFQRWFGFFEMHAFALVRQLAWLQQLRRRQR